jgi:hypothetical protein
MSNKFDNQDNLEDESDLEDEDEDEDESDLEDEIDLEPEPEPEDKYKYQRISHLNIENCNNDEDILEAFKNFLDKKINNIIDHLNNQNMYKDEIIIDGVKGIKLFNDITLFESKPRNILFLYDEHMLNNTKNKPLYYAIFDLYNSIFIKLKLFDNKIKYSRELINYTNKRLYPKLTNDLFKRSLISINELLYYISVNNNECFDIFIEENSLNLNNYSYSTSFLYIVDKIFLNCGDKILSSTEKNKIINDDYIKYIEKSKSPENRICDFNIRYHRADIRNNYFNFKYYKLENELDNDININSDKFPPVISAYIDYLFQYIDIEKTKFFIIHLQNYKHKNNYYELIDFYKLTKELIIKQYKKSIFINIDIEKLKEIIYYTEIVIGKIFSRDLSLGFTKLKINDVFNFRLLSVTMNLYSIFRMFIDDWHVESSKKSKVNLSTSCNNLEYPKNIIYFAGGAHINWIIHFINRCQYDSMYKFLSLNKFSRNDNNFIKLGDSAYIVLKRFFYGISLNFKDKQITDLYEDKVINIISIKFNNIVDIIIYLKYINEKLNNNDHSYNLDFLNEKSKLLTYIRYIQDFIDNFKYNHKLTEEFKIYYKYIRLYCELIIRNINNIIIITNLEKEINGISYQDLLYLYNKNEDLKIYINDGKTKDVDVDEDEDEDEDEADKISQLITPQDFISNLTDDFIINHLLINDDIIKLGISNISELKFYLNTLYNNIKDRYKFGEKQELNYTLNTIESIFEILKTISDNIINLSSNMIRNIIYLSYLKKFNIFINNLILILCFYINNEYHLCIKPETEITEDDIYYCFINGNDCSLIK